MTVEDKVLTAKWLSDNSLQLITINGIYYSLHWAETLCTSSSGTLDWVAVIDDCMYIILNYRYISINCFIFPGSILLTPFKQVIIPPPMFDVKLILESHIDSVLYLPHNQK